MNGMFQVGDAVRVKSWDEMERQYGFDGLNRICNPGDNVCFIHSMKSLCEKEAVIESLEEEYGGVSYHLNIDSGGDWRFRDWMLEPAEIHVPEEFQTDSFLNLIIK